MRFYVFSGLAALWASPVFACDTGPFPIEFSNGAAMLTLQDKHSLEGEAVLLRMGRGDRVLVTFYVKRPERRAEMVLRSKREQVIRSYLARKGVPASRLSVRTQPGPTPPAARTGKSSRTGVAVELISGCG